MGRFEARPSMEDGLLKYDSRQSESDTEQQQQQYYISGDVEELRAQLRERDEQLVTLKDDKADCMRQILDLKDQLYQLVSVVRRLWNTSICMEHVDICSSMTILLTCIHEILNSINLSYPSLSRLCTAAI